MRTFRIAMAQMNPTVGDLTGNTSRITAWLRDAKKANADLVVFPELAITGYPPEDLLLKPQFVADNLRALNEIAQACRGLVAVVDTWARKIQVTHIPPDGRSSQLAGIHSTIRQH
jgi:NAD+ synthase (glutamine-hydrolysing)